MPQCGGSAAGSVLAITTATSATVPLVIHILLPLMTYPSPSRSAVVSMPATFEPWPGSEIHEQDADSPLAMRGSHSSFIHSSPYSSSIEEPKPALPTADPMPGSARHSSSVTTVRPTASIPAPPYSTGMCGETRSSSAAFRRMSSGYLPVSSCSRATGAISAAPNSRTASLTASCSAVS